MTDNKKNNFANLIQQQVLQRPAHPALLIPTKFDAASVSDYEQASYAELGQRIADFQAGLRAQGLKTGDRVLLLFPVSIDLYALVVALLGLGMVPVFVDMGVGLKKALVAIGDAHAKLIVSVQAFLKYRFILPALWRSKLFSVDSQGIGVKPVTRLRQHSSAETVILDCEPDQQGIITFTLGTSGRPKGTDRTHSSLIAQHLAIREHWPDQPADIDMPCFPMLTLHNLCCGLTTVLPAVDLKQPAAVSPAVIVAQIDALKVTRFSGAPAYMKKIADYAVASNFELASVTGVLVGGSTVNAALCAQLRQAFPEQADVFVVYGSTEAEPISHTSALAVMNESGEGYLVGEPVAQTTVAIVLLPATGEPIERALELAQYRVKAGEVGEILVTGTHVLKAYVDNPEATKAFKILIDDNQVWHRTGDLGYFDRKGHLWLVGRAQDSIRVGGKIYHPYPIEARVDALPGVMRSALLSCQGVICLAVELAHDVHEDSVLATLRCQLDQAGLQGVCIRRCAALPVDRRHNSKIDRPALCHELMDRHFIVRLNRVDMLTLSNVASTSVACFLVLHHQFAFALSVLFLAMLLDALDGIWARKRGTVRDFGRYLDGFVDVLIYLVTPVLWLYQWGFNTFLYSAIIVCFLSCGIIRLAIFNESGNLVNAKSDALSYWGMPVFWSVFIIAGAYLLHFMLPMRIVLPLLGIVLLSHAVLMVHNSRFYKFQSLREIIVLTLGGSALFAGIGLIQYVQ